MPIMPTAITESGDLDERSQRRLVQYCMKCGAVAIGHFGFASEFYKVSDPDRRRLIEVIVEEVNGEAPVFIGVTAPSHRIAVKYAREAQDLGADMLMAGIPYVAVPDADGAYAFYRELSEATALPIIVQDTGLSSPILTAELLHRMFVEIEGVQYVKAEGTNFVAKSCELMERTRGEVPVIGGAGGKHMIHLLRLGVTAFMTGTEALDIHGAVVGAFLKGDRETAARIYYEQLLPYFIFYNDHSNELLKRMLHLRGVIDCPAVIPPAVAPEMSDAEREEFDWVLERIGFKKQWPNIP